MKFILVSSEEFELNETFCLELMFQAGLEIFHLRKPQWSIEQVEEFLDRLNNEYHDRIVLHDNYQLAEKYKVRGVHLNRRNKAIWDTVLDKGLHLSGSCHHLHELEQFTGIHLDYAFFSPVFPSISKDDYNPNYNLGQIAEIVKDTTLPLIALGGIQLSNLDEVREMGFAGVAVLGSVWRSTDPLDMYHQFNRKCQVNEHTY